MRQVCFVTPELAPFTGGGIGTWLANTLNEYSNSSVQFGVLFCTSNAPSLAEFQAAYPSVVLNHLDFAKPNPQILVGRELTRSDMCSEAHWRSFLVMCALEHAERTTGGWDVIEFIDWSGVGYFSINAKRLGRSFQKTVLGVRLHNTEYALRDHETRDRGAGNPVIADLERQGLINADIRVAHLQPIADIFKNGLESCKAANFSIELPPVRVNHPATRTIRPTTDTPIVFTSKIQSFKRPEIFARATSKFITDNSKYTGQIHFLAFDADSALRVRCEKAYPSPVSDRVTFAGSAQKSLRREEIIRQSVSIFPGVFEAFCFAAYEASLVGAIVILNGSNPGFGENTPWIDGENCIKFDGTSTDLSRVLDNIFANPDDLRLSPISITPESNPYWEKVIIPIQAELRDPLGISVLIPHKRDGTLLHRTMDSLLSLEDADLEIVVSTCVQDDDIQGRLVLDAIQTVADTSSGRVHLIRQQRSCDFGELFHHGFSSSTEDLIAVIPAGYEVTRNYLDAARNALADNPEYDIVLPTIRVIDEQDSFRETSHWVPLGASVYSGLFINRMSLGPLVARRNVLSRFSPNEILTSEWMWDVTLQAAFAGCKFITLDEPGLQAPPQVLFSQTTGDTEGRREVAEIVRRRFAVKGSGAVIGLCYLGDGDALMADEIKRTASIFRHDGRYEAPDSEGYWQIRALEAENFVKILSQATSVRFALRAARGAKKILPHALHKSLRAAFGGK